MRQLIDAGISHFNAQRYFEAHEAFEDLWREAGGGRRLLLQGLVQACAGLVKHQRGEPRSARTLLQRGLARLESASPSSLPEIDLPRLLADLRDVLGAVALGRPFDPPAMRRADGI